MKTAEDEEFERIEREAKLRSVPFGYIDPKDITGSKESRQLMPACCPWVGLTDEDKHKIERKAGVTEDDDGYIVSQIFRLIEAKLKEKNT